MVVPFIILFSAMKSQPAIDKNNIRIQLLAKRERLDPSAAQAAVEAMEALLLTVIAPDAAILAGYRPIRLEMDVTQAMASCAARGMRLCLPVIEAQDKPLYFRRWHMEDMLEKGRYGIEVPPATASAAKPDVVLVPLVAFDRQGNRLGYGAGYYDRTIQALRQQQKPIQVIGVGYSFQEVKDIPVEPNDEKLDMIVTEKEVIYCL